MTLKPKKQGPEVAQHLLRLIENTLDRDKAEDIVTIDLQGKTSIADFMVVASGRSTRQVSALADKLVRAIREEGFGRAESEGQNSGDWVLIDAGDVIVHLFRPEVRDFYNLEKMWSVPAVDETAASGAKPVAIGVS